MDYVGQVNRARALNPNDLNIPVLESWREYYRDNRDMSAFYLMVVYMLSAVDAYTGAHLYDFNVNDQAVGMYMKPNQFGGMSIGCYYKIK